MTMIEMTIAIAILAVTLSGFMKTFVLCERAALAANGKMIVTNSMRAAMEDIIDGGYNDARLTYGTHTYGESITYVVSSNTTYSNTKDITLSALMLYPVIESTNYITSVNSFARCIHP